MHATVFLPAAVATMDGLHPVNCESSPGYEHRRRAAATGAADRRRREQAQCDAAVNGQEQKGKAERSTVEFNINRMIELIAYCWPIFVQRERSGARRDCYARAQKGSADKRKINAVYLSGRKDKESPCNDTTVNSHT